MVTGGVVADNTVLSNFALIGREDILQQVFRKNFFTTQEVFEELERGQDRGVLPKRNWRWIKILRINSPQETRLFRLFSASFGKGESSCVSVAVSRNLKILTDDLDARKLAQRRGIPVSGTIGILVEAVRIGILSLDEGNTMLSKMTAKGYFSPFVNLDELL